MPRAGNIKNVGRHYTESPSRVVRVDSRLTNHQLKHYLELIELIDLYECDCLSSPSPRNDKFLKFVEEAKNFIFEQ